MPVVLLGTLDTKGPELQFVRDILHDAGIPTVVLDAGSLGTPSITPDVPRAQLFAAAGTNLASLQRANDRGKAVEAAARGATRIVADLHAKGQVDGILSLGGSAG